jgi:hypothetical protein
MIADVSSVLLRDFAANMQQRLAALDRGEATTTTEASAAPAGGLGIGARALWQALCRVARRFFLPYRPELRSSQ